MINHLTISNPGNEIDFRVREAKRLVGIKVHQDGVNLANSLEWCTMIRDNW